MIIRSIGLRRKAKAVTPVDSPLDLSGCSLWLDAADLTTMFTTWDGVTNAADGDRVERWEDKGPLEKNFLMSSADSDKMGPRVFTSTPRMMFDRGFTVYAYLESDMTDLFHSEISGFTLFIGQLFNSASGSRTFLQSTASSRISIVDTHDNIGGSFQRKDSDAAAIWSGGAIATATQYYPHVIVGDFSSGSLIARLNGTQFASTTMPGTGGPDGELALRFGWSDIGDFPTTASTRDIIFYQRALTNAEIARVEAYYVEKFTP